MNATPTEVPPREGALCRLDAGGAVADGYQPPLDDAELRAAFRLMLLTRLLGERGVSLQRQGRLGTIASARGQEAAMIGSAWPLDPRRDWLVPQYRELPSMLRMGWPLDRLLLYYRGHPLGSVPPEGINVLPVQIALAAQLPHAAGLGWGLRRQGSDAVVLTYFGEGAASEGDAHEALNLAGVKKAPVIFVLQNNGWAISTPAAKQTAAASLAARAAGYGMVGEQVDGNDLFAVYEATARAVTRARAGEGPTLIEALTFRLGPHNTTDDEKRYVDADEFADWEARDPLLRLRAYLEGCDVLDEAAEAEMRESIEAEIGAAVESMEAQSQTSSGQLFENVYAELTPRLRRQRQELEGGAA
ncbi:MAG: thiamine pyrophosphate-dependent enzyme [Solirubrobacterales bacterium]